MAKHIMHQLLYLNLGIHAHAEREPNVQTVGLGYDLRMIVTLSFFLNDIINIDLQGWRN